MTRGKLRMRDYLYLIFRHPMGRFGVIIIAVIVCMAVFAPFLHTVDPSKTGASEDALIPPNSQFWFGTDDLARDVWSQTLYGARVSLIIGLVAAGITVITGSAVGIISGYYGGIVDIILGRVIDFFMMLPALPLMIVLAAVLGPSLWTIILVVSVISWPATARIVRSQVLSLKERPFVEASRCIGVSDYFLMFLEILPNVVPLMFAQAILMITNAVYSESVLSFLGLGDVTNVSWGMMLHFAFESGVLARAPWWIAPPIIFIVLVIVGFTFLGTAVSDILNPSYREKLLKGAAT